MKTKVEENKENQKGKNIQTRNVSIAPMNMQMASVDIYVSYYVMFYYLLKLDLFKKNFDGPEEEHRLTKLD